MSPPFCRLAPAVVGLAGVAGFGQWPSEMSLSVMLSVDCCPEEQSIGGLQETLLCDDLSRSRAEVQPKDDNLLSMAKLFFQPP